jgi:type IV pilus assembly protein PilW
VNGLPEKRPTPRFNTGIQVFMGVKYSYRANENLARAQENGRFAMDILAKEIRMAGFMPCYQTTNVANVVVRNEAENANWFDFFGFSLHGYDGQDSGTVPGWVSSHAGSDNGDRVPGTDAVRVLFGHGDDGYTVATDQSTPNANLDLNKEPDEEVITTGSIILVCQPDKAALLQVTSANKNSKTLVHNAGGSVSPGNCTTRLATPVPACDSKAQGEGTKDGDIFKAGAQVLALTGAAYYIGWSDCDENGNNCKTTSLFRQKLNTFSSGTTGPDNSEELVRDIEQMQIRYGIADQTYDKQPTQYVTADAVGDDWNNVVAVRLSLLARTPERTKGNGARKEYPLDNEADPASDEDGHVRLVLQSTIKLRNRGLMN